MRDIKFRGYDNRSKVLVYGYYFLKKDVTLSQLFDTKENLEKDRGNNEHHLILLNGFSDWNMPVPHYKSEVDVTSIGQYTGLADMNGKEIYEGDIVFIFGMKFEVIRSHGSFCIASEDFINYKIFEDKILEYTGCDNSPAFSYVDNLIPLFELYWNYNEEENVMNCVEVIGNIFENKELLEVERG